MGTTLQNSTLIAISGLKCSGKGVASDMLQYILNAPKIFQSYKWYKLLKNFPFKKKWEVTAFAKPLKQTLGIILNKPLSWFENREVKENYYIDLNTLKIYPKFKLHEDLRLTENKFQKLIKSGTPFTTEYLLSIRQLMQYYGTQIIRGFLGDKTWINATLNRTDKIIVSDLRFKVEFEEIKKRKGVVIYIQRDSAKPGTHASEREVIDLYNENKFDYVIENNGTLEDLFNNLRKIILP